LRFHAGEGGAVYATFQAHPELQGYDGILHGGVIAALLDSAMTHCLFHGGIRGVTGDLHVRFVEPVPSDSKLVIRARVASNTPPLFCLKAEMLLSDRIVAWAEAKFLERESSQDGSASGIWPDPRHRG
jgi:uncharacterized protein (TIGR00369 family)